MTKYELEKLRGLAGGDPFQVRYHPRMYDELHHLDAMQFVAPTEGHGLADIKNSYSKREHVEFDLKEYVRITDDGREYLMLLEELMRLLPSDKKQA